MNSIDLSDPKKFRVVRKDGAAKLTKTQLKAIASFMSAQGDIGQLNPNDRLELSKLQAKYVNDPGIVGSAAVADFSLRTVSIHKTWSWFKNFSSSPGFDPAKLNKVNLTMDALVKRK